MSVDLCGVKLRNPLIAAAGTAGYVREIEDVIETRWLGAVTTKSITAEPREGNPPWRLIEVERGMLNAVGLANVGVEQFLSEKLPDARDLDAVLIGSIAGHSIDDYVTVARAFDQADDLPLVELNVSCPNTDTGLQFGDDPGALRALLREVRPALANSRMIVKLSPNVGDIGAMARAAVETGADALTLINTLSAMAIDVETRQPRLSRGSGGLSGPAIHAVAVRMVSEVYRDLGSSCPPIIGLGGVMRWQDAAEFILAGACAVGLGTAFFVDPRIVRDVGDGLARWVTKQGCSSIRELVGQVRFS